MARDYTPAGCYVRERVTKIEWKRSQVTVPRRKRSDRPPLTHDGGWEWDGKRVSFCAETVLPRRMEKHDGEACGHQLWEDEPLLEETHAALSLFDIARHQVEKTRRRGRPGLDEFEVIRVPRVVPISEEESDLGSSWKLSEWERLDALGFKRSYSEVVQGFVDDKDPPNEPGYSRLAPSCAEDDCWEYV